MRGLGDATVDGDPETFLFEADLATPQYLPDVAVQQASDFVLDIRVQLRIRAAFKKA